MTVRIARNGQVFGPYTEADVRRYLASGNILASDLAQPEGAEDWVPLTELFPELLTAAPVYTSPAYAAPLLYPDPPDFPWWAVLLLGIITGGLFAVIWDVVEAAWLRRVDRSSIALWLYVVNLVVYCVKLPDTWHTVWYNVSGDPIELHARHGMGLGFLSLVLFLITRYVFRSELLRHFNGPEPIGLRINAFWTLLFGGLYFQYKFNRINQQKRALHISVPSL